jgi:hypothetical protein
MITRDLDDPAPIGRFLDNAERHGHLIERVIVAYSHGFDQAALQSLRERVRLDILRAPDDPSLMLRLDELGVPPDAGSALLGAPSWRTHREVPYGVYRNAVLVQALLTRMDVLLFFDTDIQPRVLTGIDAGQPRWSEIDFVGAHVSTIRRLDVGATTSDYSGFYIIPPLRFDGLEDLLVGLGKELALEYMEDCVEHRCLNYGPVVPGAPAPTQKPLGGNLGLDLRTPECLAPFFSAVYTFGGECIKGRGEDTLLGKVVSASDSTILDIDLRVFHDTYGDFPRVPSIRRAAVRDRFLYACLGWIGRNPFMTWYLARIAQTKTGFEQEVERQRAALEAGAPKAARALHDARFADLPDAFEVSMEALPDTIERYRSLMVGWRALLKALRPGKHPDTTHEEPDLLVAS